MTLLAYVDATYRPGERLAGYGYIIKRIICGMTVSVCMGNKRIPFVQQGSSHVEMTAIQDVIHLCTEEFKCSPDVVFTDAQGVLHKFDSRVKVRWLHRGSKEITAAHGLAKQLAYPQYVKPPPVSFEPSCLQALAT